MRRYPPLFRHVVLRCLCIILSAGLSSRPAPALSPQKAITQYMHDAWTSQKGLPGEAVYEIMQSRDGYLWLRTSSGLVRFDGARFVRIEPVVGGETVREMILAICRSADGDLLIRSTTRTLIYKDGIFSDYQAPAALPIGSARVLFETKEHQVWVGGDNFLYRAQKTGFSTELRSTGWLFAFLQDHRGDLWIGGTYGLYQYSHGRLTNYSAGYGLKESVTALAEDRQGNLWVGMRNGLYRLHNGKPLQDAITNRFANQTVSAILEDRHGNLWVGTDASGLYRLTNGQWSALTVQEGLSDNGILSLCEAREGSLWIGTKSGLDRLRDTKLIPYTTREGLVHNDTTCMVEARDGSLFIFSQGGGLTRLKDGVATRYTDKDGLGSNFGKGMYADKDGSVWIGTVKGLSHFKDGKFTTYTDNGRLSKFAVSAINEDDISLLVASSDCQVRRFKDGKFSPYTIRGELTLLSVPSEAQRFVFTIYRDPGGTLWFGTSANQKDGLYKFAPGEPLARAIQEQVPFGVATIYDDGKGSLWLGGKVEGLARFRIRDGHVIRYTSQEGLFDDEISCILGDHRGDLWMSTRRGIFTVSRQDLDDFAEGKIKTIHPVAYGIADGMRTTEAEIPELQPAGCKTRDGKLWFTTHKGIVMVDPDHLPRNELVPPVILERIVVDQEAYRTDQNLELPPGKRNLEFDYTALSLLVPERVRFKIRLEGYDHDWVEAGNRRVASYTNLPPRKYRFHVIACNDDGVWNTIGASCDIELKPYFYEMKAFYGLCALGAILSGMGLHRFRVRQLHARGQELTRLVGERTKDLQTEVGVRQQAEVALQRANEELEQRVAERTDELSQANASLRVEITERTRAEEALRESEEAERRFGEQLVTLQEVVNTLSRADTFDDLCLQAIELGRNRLEFDRLSLWFTTEEPGTVRGTFGVDEHGQIRDERSVRISIDQEQGLLYNEVIKQVLAHKIPIWSATDTPLHNHRAENVGRGSLAMAALWDGEKVIGLIAMDNLLDHRPLTEHRLELLILYATALGYLCSRKHAEEALRTQVRLNTALFDQAISCFVLLDRDFKFIRVNEAFAKYYGKTVKDFYGRYFRDVVPYEGTSGDSLELLKHVLQDKQPIQLTASPYVFMDQPERGVTYWDLILQPIFDEQGEVEFLFFSSIDVTERKQAEQSLRESEDRYRTLVEQAGDGIFIADQEGRYTDVNASGCRMLGYTREELLTLSIADVVMPEEIPRIAPEVKVLTQGEKILGEWQFRRKDQTSFPGEVSACMLPDGRLLGILRDITERKQAEERILQALEEKDVLLKEVHHRVKNNLQVLSSLLKFQSNFLKDPADRELFQESQNRIRSMAIIHEQLYQSRDLARIDFGDYIRRLVVYLSRTHGVNAHLVKMEVEVDAIRLDLDVAIPCGLIINELVSNALKYAFPGERAGTIRVSLSHETSSKPNGAPEHYTLIVADDGIGLPPEVNLGTKSTMGLQLVSMLVDQLEGHVELARSEGTAFHITFASHNRSTSHGDPHSGGRR